MKNRNIKKSVVAMAILGLALGINLGDASAARLATGDDRALHTVSTQASSNTIATIANRVETGGTEEVIANIGVSQTATIYSIDRSGSSTVIKRHVANSYDDYLSILADKSADGDILMFESKIAKSNLEKASREITQLVEKNKEGHLKGLKPLDIEEITVDEAKALAPFFKDVDQIQVMLVVDEYVDNRPPKQKKDILTQVNDGMNILNNIMSIRSYFRNGF